MAVTGFDITSANATLVLTVDELFPAGVNLEMFAADQSYAMESNEMTLTRMGVDGHMVAGWIPAEKTVTIMLEAASPSHESLFQVWAASETNKKPYQCSLVATVPSIGKVYTWSKGYMTNATPAPSAKQVLDPTSWTFKFESLEVSDI